MILFPPPQNDPAYIERQSAEHPNAGPVGSDGPSSHISVVPLTLKPSPQVEQTSAVVLLPPAQNHPGAIPRQVFKHPEVGPFGSPGPSSQTSGVPESLLPSPHVEQTSAVVLLPPTQYHPDTIPRQVLKHPLVGPLGSPGPSSHNSAVPEILFPSPQKEHFVGIGV